MEDVLVEQVAKTPIEDTPPRFSSFLTLMRISWEWYLTRIGFISSIATVTFIASIAFLLNAYIHPIQAVIVSFVALLVSMLAQFVLFSFVVDGIRETAHFWNRIRTTFLSYLWVNILGTLATLGSAVIFIIPIYFLVTQYPFLRYAPVFLLIPLIFVTVIFSLSNFVLFAEGKRGVQALQKSWFYVETYFWRVMGRLVILFAVFMFALFAIHGVLDAFGIPTTIGETQTTIGTIVESFFGTFIVTPIGLVFLYTLYQALVVQKSSEDEARTAPRRTMWIKVCIGLGILGVVISIALVVFILYQYSFLLALLPVGLQSIATGISAMQDGIVPFGL